MSHSYGDLICHLRKKIENACTWFSSPTKNQHMFESFFIRLKYYSQLYRAGYPKYRAKHKFPNICSTIPNGEQTLASNCNAISLCVSSLSNSLHKFSPKLVATNPMLTRSSIFTIYIIVFDRSLIRCSADAAADVRRRS